MSRRRPGQPLDPERVNGGRPGSPERPSLLFYCQHSLGMGHLVRSLTLAAGLSERFRVVLLNGGRLPEGIRIPSGVEIVDLPPLGFDDDMQLVSRDPACSLEKAQRLRRALMLGKLDALQPRVVLIELFPFGRKKFAGELLPLLERAHAGGASRPVIACSLRDILVGQRRDQQAHDERAAETANRFFDAILVHSDPEFARLQDSLCAGTPLRVPVHHTGFVAPAAGEAPAPEREPRIVVSAGGGLVGEPLLRAAVLARRPADLQLTIIAGPFLPEPAWQGLRELARGQPGLTLRRFVPDLAAELRRALASVSQCGYNTVLDILRSKVKALVVPFGEGREDEQMKRARRLERLGALRVLDPKELSAARLAEELKALRGFRPAPVALDLDGARNSATVLAELVRERSAATPRRESPRLAGARR